MKQTKYVLVEDNTPIKLGDTVCLRKEAKTPFGYYLHEKEVLLTEDNLPEFIEKGVIKEVVEENDLTIGDIRKEIATSLGLGYSETVRFVNRLSVVYPAAAISLYLKTASKLYNKTVGEYCFFFDLGDGTIKKIKRSGITDVALNNCGIFSTKEDAIHAVNLIHALIERVYGK